jgi:quercetin dioxygenase-like cupin family protein
MAENLPIMMNAMIAAAVVLFMGSAFVSGRAQDNPTAAVGIADEPHHSLILQNEEVRVFRLKLQSHEVTLRHRHKAFYAQLSLRQVTIGNEVRGRRPVLTQLDAGELHTSKGGFLLAERNESPEPAELLVIEATKPNIEGFNTPMGGFRYHDAAFGELFEAPAMRGYTMTIAAGGRTEQHTENYDRLVVAISDLKFRETVVGQAPSELEMEAGDTRWLPRGMTHATTNIGTSPATFITLQFN